jgi:DNA-binding NarL/FixJ family response regulator
MRESPDCEDSTAGVGRRSQSRYHAELMKETTTIRVLLADDHPLLRSGLRAILEGEAGIEVVAEAGDGQTAVALAAELSPDVVVMDINMPHLNGVEATRQVTSNGGGTRVVVLSGHADGRYVSEVMRAGASGYVLKDTAFEELAPALRAVAANGTYVSPRVANGAADE